jgi:hypothetical protein
MTARFLIVLVAGVISMNTGGCASDYSARDDLSSGQIIGLVIPVATVESMSSEDFIQLFDSSVTEDRLKNSGVGAGKGAAIGTVAGVGIGALLGCAATGPYAPICWGTVLIPSAVIGAGTGAVQGSDTDSRERAEVAPTQLHDVNKVIPDMQHDYLTKEDLDIRALRVVRRKIPDIKIIPADPNGDRYRFAANDITKTKYSDVNLVLAGLSVRLEGKREDQPKVALLVDATWLLTKNDTSMESIVEDRIVEGSYKSEYFFLSEWLTEDGALLKDHINNGLDYSFNNAFAALTETEEDKWIGISPGEPF